MTEIVGDKKNGTFAFVECKTYIKLCIFYQNLQKMVYINEQCDA